jgi:hypothetical protein
LRCGRNTGYRAGGLAAALALAEKLIDAPLQFALLFLASAQPGVEIAGIGTVAGAKRSLRSLHVYANGAETVVDCIGPLGDSKAFTATICDPVISSLNLG